MSFFTLPVNTAEEGLDDIPRSNSNDEAESEGDSGPEAKKAKGDTLVAYSSDDEDDPADSWTPVWSADHESYYYHNASSDQVVWELPEGAMLAAEAGAEADEEDGDNEGPGFVAPHIVEPKTVVIAGCTSRAETLKVVERLGAPFEAVYQPREAIDDPEAGARQWCVRFADEQGAAYALALHGTDVYPGGGLGGGRKLSVKRATTKNYARESQPRKLFLRHLPLSVTDAEVLQFVGHGAEKPVIRIRAKGGAPGPDGERPFVGCAVVVLPTGDAAVRALAALRAGPGVLVAASGERSHVEAEVSSRRVWEGVSGGDGGSWAAGRQGRSDFKGGGDKNPAHGGGEARPEGCLTVWVGGLPKDTDEGRARAVMAVCGPLASFRLIRDPYEGDCKGFAFAEFQAGEGAEAAVERLNGAARLGTKLKVRYATDKPRANHK